MVAVVIVTHHSASYLADRAGTQVRGIVSTYAVQTGPNSRVRTVATAVSAEQVNALAVAYTPAMVQALEGILTVLLVAPSTSVSALLVGRLDGAGDTTRGHCGLLALPTRVR